MSSCITCSIYIEGYKHGPWMGHFLPEVGCMWLAHTPDEVIREAPRAISQFYAWLHTHGELDAPLYSPEQINAELVATLEIPGFGTSGAPAALFDPDREPLTDQDIATTIRRLGYVRRNLLELLAELPPEALDWRPPNGKRTIRENVQHVCNAQWFFVSGGFGPEAAEILPDPWPEELMPRASWVLGRCVRALATLPDPLRSGLRHVEKPTEDWTSRKMCRRFVEHEREHFEVLRRTVAQWREAWERQQPSPEAPKE